MKKRLISNLIMTKEINMIPTTINNKTEFIEKKGAVGS